MAKDENKQLAIDVIARISSLEKEMKRAQGITKGSYDQMSRSSRTATKQMEADMVRTSTRINQALAATSTKIGSFSKAFVGGLVGGVAAGGIAGIVGQVGRVANSIAQVGDEAKRAGVSAKAFQEWKFVAEQNRIGIDQMTDGLKELNLRADEFIQTGKGSASESFMRLGYSAEELSKKLKDPSALLLEIIDRLGKFDKASQIRISDELFGGSAGERFVELLDQGEDGIRRTIQRAHELGVVIDDELIQKAADIDRRFNEISNTVGIRLKSAIVSAADSLAEFIDGFRDFEKRRDSQLSDNLADLGKRRMEIERQMIDIREMQRNMVPDASGGYTWTAEIGLWQAELDKIAADEARIVEILNQRSDAMKRSGDRTWTPPTPPPGGFGSTGAGRDKAAAQAEREAEAVRRLIGELEHELALIGATDLERDTANELRRAGAAATDDQRAKIIALVTALHAEAEAQRQTAEAASFYRDVAGGALNDLRSALSDGKLEWEELATVATNALDRIADRRPDASLNGIIQFREGEAR